MNEFFEQCSQLDGTKVKQFHLLSCIHVHKNDSVDKDYSIYCDTQHHSFTYAEAEDIVKTPRYSGVQYTTDLTHSDTLEGQVVGIISYSLPGQRSRIYLLINRFDDLNDRDFFKRVLPQRIVQYHKMGQKITTDCIPIQYVLAPLFYVPALDKGMDMDFLNVTCSNKPMFYVITQEKVLCLSIFSYSDYLTRNNTAFSSTRTLPDPKCLCFNPFLTLAQMEYIKEILDVGRNISLYDLEDEEEFEYDFEDDDYDLMEDET